MSDLEHTLRYSIQDVELQLGIPRTKIRHYVDRGLLTLEKEESSGYYFYQHKDLVRLCQIVYYREILGFSVEEVLQILETSEIEQIEDIFDKQLGSLSDDIMLKENQLSTMLFNQKMIDNQHKFRDKLTLIPFDTAYVLPYSYYYNPTHLLYPIMYGASEFSFDGEEVTHERKCCLVFEKDSIYVEEDRFQEAVKGLEKIETSLCVYTVTLTKEDAHDPELLLPAISWATKHRFRINGRIFLTHFFPYYRKEESYRYVEAFLPIDIL